MSARRPECDVAIVGAGPAGQTLALALAQDGFEVALLDAGSGPAPAPVAADLRVFALAPAATALLAGLGAWPPPQARRVCAYRHMHVWQGDPNHGVRFDAATMGWPALGHIIEHGVLQHALAGCVAAQARIASHWAVRVESIVRADGHVEVGLAGGGSLRARVLVGADGAGSPVRALAGLQADRVDYGQCGLVANVDTAVAHDATARQRFLASGPLAFLPLADGRSSIVWSLPAAEAQRLLALDRAVFGQALAVAAGGVLGRVDLAGDRALFPLARQLARDYHRDRVALVGDAAHSVHPLAGQGLNLGLLDVAALAQVLAAARDRGLDPGAASVLAQYARWRQGDNALAARAFEAIDRLYRLDLPGAALARSLGQRLVERLPPLKHRFIEHAAGLAGRVPTRCRGATAGAPVQRRAG
jgi:ubiquinone biosynthesis UbiH/UbiF/VisC/COQ6 family hydroxylase